MTGPDSVGPVTADAVLRDRLRAALTVAMKDRDRIATDAYRTALAALDNAEAVDAATTATATATDTGMIAGAAPGAGATEADRNQLSEQEVRAVLLREIVEHRRAADDFAGAGRPADALRLWAQADLLQAILAGGP